jgi:hypothetical protein
MALRSAAIVLGAAFSVGLASPIPDRVQGSLGPDRYVQDVSRAPMKSQRRGRELEWKKNNMQTLREHYEGQWVVLESDHVMSHGADPVQAVREARERGARNPYVFFVERQRKDVAWLGL